MRQDCDPCVGDSNHERACCGSFATARQSRRVGWADDTDHEHASDVEYQKADEEGPGGLWEIASWRLHLSCCDDEQFWRKAEWKSRSYNAGDERNELTFGPRHEPRVQSAWICPVAEIKRVTRRSSAEEEYDAENEQATDSNDLQRGEPELCFAVVLNWEYIEADNNQKENGQKDANVNG